MKRTYRLSPSTSSLSTTLERSKLLIVDLSTRKYEVTQESKRVTNYKSASLARCVISPTNANPEGLTCNKTTTTTVAGRYAKARNVTTTGVMIGATLRRVPKSTGRVPKTTATRGIPKSVVQGRVLKSTRRDSPSPVLCTVREPTIPMRNIPKICIIKLNRNRARTTTTTNALLIATIKTAAPTTTAT